MRDEINERVACVEEAFAKGWKIDDPDSQFPQWLRVGVHRLEQGQTVSPMDLESIDRMGGTDHPDPTLASSPTEETISSLKK